MFNVFSENITQISGEVAQNLIACPKKAWNNAWSERIKQQRKILQKFSKIIQNKVWKNCFREC